MFNLATAPELEKFTRTYASGETLFLEGDATTDIYILISGKLDIIKGKKKISEMSEPGALFGEMSYLLGEKRTATVKAVTEVRAALIPSCQLTEVIKEFPGIAPEISRILAQRLQETTNMVYGLKEFCDQLPDAVMITTDQDQKILAWNTAAEKLYGRSPDQMRNLPLKEIYENPDAYAEFQNELAGGQSISGKKLQVKTPTGEPRYVSTNTTVLYDGHQNVQGLLFLARDITKFHLLEKKYRQIRNWLIPAAALIAVFMAIFFWAYPNFSRGTQILDYKKESFKERISLDYPLLIQAMAEPLAVKDHTAVIAIMRHYFDKQDPISSGIKGLILLDPDKKVIMAYSPDMSAKELQNLIGSSYGAIDFNGSAASAHKLLTLFRPTEDHPMGEEGVELAFAMSRQNGPAGWLIFQLDMNWLKKEFGIDFNTLKRINFEKDS